MIPASTHTEQPQRPFGGNYGGFGADLGHSSVRETAQLALFYRDKDQLCSCRTRASQSLSCLPPWNRRHAKSPTNQ